MKDLLDLMSKGARVRPENLHQKPTISYAQWVEFDDVYTRELVLVGVFRGPGLAWYRLARQRLGATTHG